MQFFTALLLCCFVYVAQAQAQSQTDASPKNWLEANASEQAKAIAQGKLTSQQLVFAYLNRIDSLDPRINSILRLNSEAMKVAAQRDLDVKNGKPLGPLHGVPVLLKDNIETKDMPTTAGAMALVNNDTGRDSPLVAGLREAGAIILGKTNLSEWANFRSEDSISGWSAVGGLTRNPHNLARTACGSSSGSGAAMAANLASLTVGTETNGSIICPASFNGVVGYKPTVGLIPQTYIVPISSSQDTAGPITATVSDAGLMASVMADKKVAAEHNVNLSQLSSLNGEPEGKLKGKRIGVVRFSPSRVDGVNEAYEQALDTLKAQGAVLIDINEFSMPDEFWDKSYYVLLSEFKTTLNTYLTDSPAQLPVRSLKALIAFNQNDDREMQLFDQSIFIKSEETNGASGEAYQSAVAFVQNATRKDGIDKLLADNEVDILVAPSNNPAFLIDAVYGDHAPKGFTGIGYMAAIAGYPHVSVPMGAEKGLPLGLSFISSAWQDEVVLSAANAFEKAHQFALKPQFYPSRAQSPDMEAVFESLNP
ncbi:amidase [Alteromonas confluentis]|uniref:Amidase n=1 Tax=Alteromonas confluentis TaxID=1656094 RepID=A0A1E7ZFQ8_9ALTE|nr:amidase [Alteromonas confluentis]OFC72358.1 amidase [Alteromonas confluentis]